MSRIFVFNWISVDGIFSGPNGETDWFTSDPELEAANLSALHIADTLLFGRVTFKMMEAFWPTPGAAAAYPEVAAYMNETAKHSFSTTVNSSHWPHSSFHNVLNRDTVRAIKETAKKDIVVLGSGSVSMALQELQLIDEYILLLDPQLLGRGKPFFKDVDPTALQLLEARTFPSGIVRLHYKTVHENRVKPR
ncbi:dihydrofolate reductase family protein [Niabella pedocola]|uniref:Dihydrofolate reductase family protein n=1 Tax=Niabella pedocola TaxID=1752077 RepID=A0ABS8PQB2_9BACT|nr:dihydrofolate reductase family protein [Niabella pedocola]MCD2423285.1 dihydrofolate reductase family protein [Niabella pedocola]